MFRNGIFKTYSMVFKSLKYSSKIIFSNFASDCVGAVSAQATISLDCMFPNSSTIPRSILREVVNFFLPIFDLMFLILGWLLQSKISKTTTSQKQQKRISTNSRRSEYRCRVLFFTHWMGRTIIFCISLCRNRLKS